MMGYMKMKEKRAEAKRPLGLHLEYIDVCYII
jgi:hypothetical protein